METNGEITLEGNLDIKVFRAKDIEEKIRRRDEARDAKDWAEADRLRDELAREGIVLEDTPTGTKYQIKKV